VPYVVYLDESGDHDLTKINPHFPIFVLVLAVIDQAEYIDTIVPAFNWVKFAFFGSEAVIFHSYEIRKSKGVFACLLQPRVRTAFLPELSKLMRHSAYRIISVAVKKTQLVAASSASVGNPYTVALERGLERLIEMLEMRRQRRVVVIAEQRGKREDADLRESFDHFVMHGTPTISRIRVQAISWTLIFAPKRMNCVGHQIADLAGGPIAAHVLRSLHGSPASDQAYDIIRDKLARQTLDIVPE
jgi:hypothetical protein